MKVRIKATPPELEMDGIRLDHLDPGTVHEVSPAIGVWLMAEGYAVLEMRDLSRSDRRSSSHTRKQFSGLKDRRKAVHDRRSQQR